MTVISCTRSTTQDGYSSIQATVQLKNDGQMSIDHVKLYFSFLREPQHASFTDPNRPVDNGSDNTIYTGKDYVVFSEEKESKNKDGKTQRKKSKRKFEEEEFDSEHETKKSKQSNECKLPDNEVGIQTNDNDEIFSPKTIVTYKIDFSVDNGKIEPLLAVQVLALGDHPSVEPAVPMDQDDDDDYDDEEVEGADAEIDAHCNDCGIDGGSIGMKEKNGSGKLDTRLNNNHKEGKENVDEFVEVNCEDGDNIDRADRFGVLIEPVNVVKFLDLTTLNLNDQSVFYFLMTFPFYEHEWDISGFLYSAVFDGDEDEEVDDCCDEGETGCMMGCCASNSFLT